MSVARHHAEWLSLVEQSGPFLSMPVLLRVLPQGLDAHDPDHHRQMKLAHGEWEAASDDQATHRAWVRFVLGQTLEMPDDVLAEGQAVANIKCEVAEHGETLRPDLAVLLDGKPCLLVHVYRPGQNLDRPPAEADWKASCGTRMMELLHAADVRLGLVTNGEQWMLVYAPRGETTGFASWYASYWIEEPITFRAFRTLLSARRFFSVPEGETLAAMLKESAENQHEVTDQLGYQVRKAVEVLIQSLDRADQDHGRALLGQVAEGELYEAALTVMMRLVFLFSAEERGLLMLGDPLYDEHYAVSTLRERLRTDADQHGEEVLERRLDAWVRLLAAFRAVHGGVNHHRLTLPAYGGHLFDPDRFPFLEGRPRKKDDKGHPANDWRAEPANPLPVNNRTVLHLLEALQLLRVKVPGGGPAEARRLSFRALDIEQIGHVYEGLLDHTAVRAKEPALGLAGAKDQEPEVPLAELETHRAKGEKELLKYLKEVTGRSESALKKALAVAVEGHDASRLRVACGNRAELFDRVRPFTGLLREDTFGYPVVIPAGSVYVTEGTARRATGTHYTPRSLTEPIVRYTLEPLIYDGPSDGKPNDQWRLKSARELLALKVCDIACGSGAFLVETCRYLSERLVEAWQKADQFTGGKQGRINFDQPDAADPAPRLRPRITPFGEPAKGRLGEQIIPDDDAARLTFARRLVAQRCLYGVDKNSMAVEIAKLSLWLLTLAKGQPFTFLDHAVRHGDSLVGVHDLDQLRHLTLSGRKGDANLFISSLDDAVKQAVEKRLELESLEVIDIEDVHRQEGLFREADILTKKLRAVGDVLIGTALGHDPSELITVAVRFQTSELAELSSIASDACCNLTPFHWPLEYPEVFFRTHKAGFDAIVGNPPWGQKAVDISDGHKNFLQKQYPSTKGIFDLFRPFIEQAVRLVRSGGSMGLVLPDILLLKNYPATRKLILDKLRLRYLSWHAMPFAGATIDAITMAGIVAPADPAHRFKVCRYQEGSLTEYLLDQADFLKPPGYEFNLHLANGQASRMNEFADFPKLTDYFEAHEGVHSGNIRSDLFVDRSLDTSCREMYFGRDELRPHRLVWGGRFIRLSALPERRTKERYANAGRPEWFSRPKVLVRRTGDYVLASADESGRYASNNYFVVLPHRAGSLDVYGLSALLNSQFMTWYYRTLVPRQGRAFAELKIRHLVSFPLPKAIAIPGGCDQLNELGRKRSQSDGEQASQLDCEIETVVNSFFGTPHLHAAGEPT